MLELDPALVETLRTLEEHGVEFILVGGLARAIHDDGGFVDGVTIVPAAYGRNAARLAGALSALDGTLAKPVLDGVDYRLVDLREIAPCSFQTRSADIDVSFEPPGTRGYRDLFDEAAHVALAPGVRPLVAAPADIERIERGAAPAEPYATLPADAIRVMRGGAR